MNKIIKRVLALGSSLALVTASFLPFTKAYATNYGEGEYGLAVGVDSNAEWVTHLTVNGFEWTSDQDEYLATDGKYALTIELQIPDDQNTGTPDIRTGGDMSERFEVREAGEPEDMLNGKTKFTFTANYGMSSVAHERLSLQPYIEESHGGENPEPQPGDSVAHLLVACVEEEGASCIDETYGISNIAFSINDGWVEPYRGENEDIEYYYNDDGESETVSFRIETLWHIKLTHLLINDAEIDIAELIDYDNQESYLSHYEYQVVSLEMEVPKAIDGIYNIAVTVAPNENQHIGNFLWTADPAQASGENYIGHSSISPVAVEYTLGGITYSCNMNTAICQQIDAETSEELLACNLAEDEECGIPYVEFWADPEAEFDDGSLTVPAGARITMRIVPDYGYQVLNVNMADLVTTDDGIGEFTFTVPAGAAYFVADVVEISDTVNPTTAKVSSGAIDLGAQTTLDHGTARLDIEDIELTDETKEKFADVVSKDGYEVKDYLNISLYNITYRGTEDEAWEEPVESLNEPATITLQLEEGVNGNDVVIVHEKHDGSYEIIPTTYDPVTNTLTFTTASFSNYAIASRTTSAPNTGAFTRDSSGVKGLLHYAVFISVSLVVIIVLTKQYHSR
ncbi:hypothetical protein IJH29_02540 [Candidatus Saccharibacteria bacterium]|nr:hypothetical protein [Candidatus Saccharibacteria bacterium]